METHNNRKMLFCSMLGVLLAFGVYKIFSVLTNNLAINYYVLMVIRETVFAAAALIVACLLHKTGVLRWKSKGWGTGLLCGMLFVLMVLWALTDAITDMISQGGPTIRVWEFLLLLLLVAVAGFNEELLFRGILQNAFHDNFGESSVGSLRKAFIFTGFFFGALHIFNIFTGAPVVSTLLQVLQVSFLGMLFAAVYYRSGRNLWICVVIHAVYDLSSFLSDGVLLGRTASEESSGYAVVASVVMTVVCFLIFLFITRKKKLLPFLQNNEA